MKSEIAVLAYYPEKQRSKNNSFEGNYNIGANVIIRGWGRVKSLCDIRS